MGKFRIHLLVVGVFLCALSFPGCSSNSAITITLTPTTSAIINAGQTQNITAALTNDTHNQGVTWALTGYGSLTNQTNTAVTYVAPVGISAENSATVTATSVANTSVTASLVITVDPVLAFSTTTLPVGTVNTPYVGVISAVGATGTFTWTLTSGTLPAGLSLSSSTSSSVTILGTPTAVGTSTFTIQVTDSEGGSVSRTLGITINPPPPLSVATQSLPDGMVGTPYGGSQGVSLQAASGKPPYTWTYTGTLPPGLAISSAGVISGTPTTAGTFPNITVTVKDSSSPQQTASATLTITINPSNAGNYKLSGNYAFLVSGFESSGNQTFNSVTAGSFFADGNGNITGGLLDSNSNGPAGLQTAQDFTGTYAIGSNGLGTMSFVGGGSPQFALAMTADGNAQMIEFGNTTGSGVVLKQTTPFSASEIQGNYALGFLGVDKNASRYGFAGQFQADGVKNFNNGMLDSDDSATGASSMVSFSGGFTAPSAVNGRGTITLTVGSAVTNYSFYVVSATQLLVMETDSIAGQTSPLVSGSILQQPPGSFSDSSLTGVSVLETTALNGSTTVAQVGLLTTGGGASSLSGYENNGTATQQTSGNGTYSVASNGRVTLTNSGIASPDPVLYLVSSNQAFIVGTDTPVTFGFMEAQSGSPFSTLSGTYAGGLIAPVQSGATEQVDILMSQNEPPPGPVSFTTDLTSGTGLIQNQPSTATYTLGTNGAGTFAQNSSSTTGYLYMVSPTEFYELYAGSAVMVEHFQ